MKLGLYMATQWRQGADLGPELANLIEQTRVARASGLASLMVGQHFVSSPLQMFQAMPLLARLAAEADGMMLGPGLLLLPLLNPVIVAEETATLDWLTGGNAVIGLGLGYRQEEFDSIGVPFKERVPRFIEGVEVIRKLWRDDVVEYQGQFHRISGVQASLKPKRPGGPPIWMAGDVEVAVKRAARLADAWMPSPMVTEEEVGRLGHLFRDRRAALDLPAATEFPVIRECHVGSGTGNALDEVREPLAFKYEAYASWGGDSGFVPAAGIRGDFDAFARQRFIIGSESEVVDRIGRFGERTGANHLLLRVQWPGLDQKTAVRTLERLGRVVEQVR
ncbi:Flavin-dependent oxidoreductase, luciferase family (includes alkanesulfonate monooxygenase SsuD and methylene tetrahydromethanopterin reductase) [Enhydrobacter aerosaccus]|uniref:Flavin-dependent oxidoreductase, luciferase family (Includes alkanesulfonate monooxygenase SsuD and methylene tetrahydromethanopterin reductase) n=1 Tax=Enhydrobacter aerosaccus TaxID=225324 RepID=A0A1T4JUF5_9HYPH|nr:LLM class flavin-dependent oxidoreductase [Enhydrobacter aerosaccus]SJZ33830.1 Flavin-dependent oxidoreductase, luciferase family (includes alkanesulfonate monooxygenase SsuD and methylene tetrahydromethanopterin reductase) [Enhydrobacter aerosaccus]